MIYKKETERSRCILMQIEPIAHIHTDFPTKFGVPRKSGLGS